MPQVKIEDADLIKLKVDAQVMQEKLRFLERENEDLRLDKTTLSKKVDHLMEALVSKEAPMAYADLKQSESIANMTPEEEAEIVRRKEEAKIYRQYVTELEKPTLFKDPEELMSTFSRAYVKSPGMESVHGNDES